MIVPDSPQWRRPVAVSTLVEMGRLARNRPVADAPPAVLAEWYHAKADLHHRCAAEALAAGNIAEEGHEEMYARRDRRRAEHLAATARLGLGVAA